MYNSKLSIILELLMILYAYLMKQDMVHFHIHKRVGVLDQSKKTGGAVGD